MKLKTLKTPDQWLKTAETLAEALPYMRRFAGETFVVKYGGHAMGEETLLEQFARDIVLMKQVGIRPIVVHGGGPQIGAMLSKLKIKSEFAAGLRITDKATVEIVEMVLSGTINKQLVAAIEAAGGTAVGLSGKDGGLIEAKKVTRKVRDPDSNIERALDLGFVGEPSVIKPAVLEDVAKLGMIPVVAPIGFGKKGETFNINADTAAGAIAAAMGASKLILLTDVKGVLTKNKELISEMTPAEAKKLLKNGTASGGMIPKIETCLKSLAGGVRRAHILDGRIPHVLLIETFTKYGAGTMIYDRKTPKAKGRKS